MSSSTSCRQRDMRLHILYFSEIYVVFFAILLESIAVLQDHVAQRTWKSLFEYTFIVIRTLSTHYKQSALKLICRNWHFRAIRRPYSF